MTDKLDSTEWALVIESLGYTKRVFSDYTKYPNYEYKRYRIAEMVEAIRKVRLLRDANIKEAE